ncbi:MAG TPA: hypothetical protein VF899_19570 [Pyrinomonadaceae bacterium]
MIDPKTISLRRFATVPFFAGVMLLLSALTFYYFAVLKIDYNRTEGLDLAPNPDAIEYFAQAKALRKDGWPSIRIGYDKLPSRYPCGYPVLMLPWLKILGGTDAILAPFRTNQTVGLLLLLAVFGFYTYLAMPLTGGLAALLLVTLPGFFTFCRSSISEISASLFIVLAFMFAYLGLEEERRWKIYASAVFLGLSLNIRIQSLFLAPLLLAMALFPVRGMRLRWFLHCAAIPIIFALAASPTLVLNTIQFHSPFKTGYDFWVPPWSEKHIRFSLRYFPANVDALWREFALQPPRDYYAANLFGTGTSFVPAFILLVSTGFFFIRINRFVICAFLAGLTTLAALLTYKFGGDARFYLPLLILLVAVAVLPVIWAAKNMFAKTQILASLAIFVLFSAACLGYPSRSGYNRPKTNRSQAWDAVHFPTRPLPSTRFIAQRRFAKLLRRQPGIVLSDINPVYLNALLPKSFIAAPIDGNHSYRWSKVWPYDRPQALALVEQGLRQSLAIYALFVSPDEIVGAQSRLPAIPGYEWHMLNNARPKPAILKLTPVANNETMVPPS